MYCASMTVRTLVFIKLKSLLCSVVIVDVDGFRLSYTPQINATMLRRLLQQRDLFCGSKRVILPEKDKPEQYVLDTKSTVFGFVFVTDPEVSE